MATKKYQGSGIGLPAMNEINKLILSRVGRTAAPSGSSAGAPALTAAQRKLPPGLRRAILAKKHKGSKKTA